MSATLELFDLFKRSQGVDSDNAAATKLGISRQTVCNWRKRASQAEPRVIEKMCNALRLSSGPWLLRMLEERASHPDDRKVWRRLAKCATFHIHIGLWICREFLPDCFELGRIAGSWRLL